MTPAFATIEACLTAFDLPRLFVDELGWSRLPAAPMTILVALNHNAAPQTLVVAPVAQMAGIPVLTVAWPLPTLPTVAQRLAVYAALVTTVAVEHVLVYTLDQRQMAVVWAHRRVAAVSRPELRTLPFEVGVGGRTTIEQLSHLAWSLAELAAGEPDVALVVAKLNAAFDVELVTQRFFEQYKKIFAATNAVIQHPGLPAEKWLFTQKLFNRLLFLRFLEKRGWLQLSGRNDYLRALWQDYGQHRAVHATFYQERLHLLFFTGLNNATGVPLNIGARPLIGTVPYLNGGLFEADADDTNTNIIIPDAVFAPIMEHLLYSFNFTITESTPLTLEVAVDPEMLGKIFEELVTGRQTSGSYYTPKPVVAFMSREALKGHMGGGRAVEQLVDADDEHAISVPHARELLQKLADLRIVDPACGSGAYLLGMVQELLRLMHRLDTRAHVDPRSLYEIKLAIIQQNIYGVDRDSFAVNIARLRLWLSLIVDFDGPGAPPPLPNLDFKIEVGDSLLAPIPPNVGQQGFRDVDVFNFQQAKAAFLTIASREKPALLAEIATWRAKIAEWTHAGAAVQGFDWAVEFAEVFSRAAAPGFDLVIANPPYGASVEDWVRDRYFPRAGGAQSKDTYGLFMARALDLARPGGQFCFIVSDTWRTIKSHRPLRQRLLAHTTVQHVLDLPPWIFNATVNTCIVTLQNSPPPAEHRLIAGDLRGIAAGHWTVLAANLRAVARQGSDAQTTEYARYTYPQALIARYANLSFFVASPRLYALMHEPTLVRLGDIAAAVHGISTGNNKKYIRAAKSVRGNYPPLEDWMRMPGAEMAQLSEAEKIGGVAKDWQALAGCFVPLEKGGESDASGGWLPNYHVPTEYYINWAKGAITDMRKNIGSRFINSEHFFKPGLTFSISGVYAPTFRLNSSGVFEAKGSGIFCDQVAPTLLLGILCSTLARYQFKCYIKHSVDTSGDDIKEFRFPMPNAEHAAAIQTLVEQIIAKQSADPRYAYYQHEQPQLDALVYALYGLTEDDVREVELWFCRRYRKLADAQGLLTRVQTDYAKYLSWAERQLTSLDADANDPVLQMIAQGESHALEFKSSLRWDLQHNVINKDLEYVILKTIAAFLNAEHGGTLLIGVADDGEVLGLGPDYRTLSQRPNRDGFEQHLTNLIKTKLIFYHPLVEIRFHYVAAKEVCIITVKPALEPIWMTNKKNTHEVLSVRFNNTTQELGPRDAARYVLGRWGGK